ncbi:hypothetical protein SAMN05421767_10946 [Granulicatella balaenopterae]|uniref:Uncharacterized protein n=1 Tax=Granulicatella balaenopterae TaxID=137733 RepID=A0A1H9JLP8_9LACT|nr:hypothetical protein [Granulicatella balaenopterae]SEQ87772.1 hypothetical protein SAMN05421767_10946 [Granulicatella balaenopterae]
MKKYMNYLFIAIVALLLTACSNTQKPLSTKTFGELMEAEGYEIILQEDASTSISVALNDDTNVLFFTGKDNVAAKAFYQTLAKTLKEQNAENSEATITENEAVNSLELIITTTDDTSYHHLIWHDARVLFITTIGENTRAKSEAILEELHFEAISATKEESTEKTESE